MEKVAILTDSGCGLDERYMTKDTFIMPLYIHFKDKSYKDMEEISPKQVYDMMKNEIPKTSIPSPGEIQQKYDELIAKGYTKILVITISSNLSGIYSAFKMQAENVTGADIYVVDSKNIYFACGFLVLYAQYLIENNKVDSFDALCKKVESSVPKTTVYFVIDTLEYLIAGGRIGKVMGGLGTLLKIKPIIACNEDGVYETIKKGRSLDKAVSEIMDMLKERLDGKKDYFLGYIYRNDENVRAKIEDKLSNEIKTAKQVVTHGLVSPALGVHVGDSVIGIGACYFD